MTKTHLTTWNQNDEWITPPAIIECARETMGSIYLDPASSDLGQKIVKAEHYHTAKTNGLSVPWVGNVWLNPPYSHGKLQLFVDFFSSQRSTVRQAIILTNDATDTRWFRDLLGMANAMCFCGRLAFLDPTLTPRKGVPRGQVLFYFGRNTQKFLNAFRTFGPTILI